MGRLTHLANMLARFHSPVTKLLKRILPHTLFGRSLLIVILPIILLQILVTYIFYERHWDNVARRLAKGVAGEVAAVISLADRFPGEAAESSILSIARDQMNLSISFDKGVYLDPTDHEKIYSGFLDHHLALALQEHLPGRAFTLTNNDRLESVIALTGLDVDSLIRKTDVPLGQGGPLV